MRLDWGEAGLRIVGMTLATTSALFAVHMTMSERKPDINGLEHLAIYAKPKTLAAQRAAKRQTGVDYMATGSTSITIIDAAPGSARVDTPFGVKSVAVGEKLAGYGRVKSIEKKDEKWRIVTERAIIGGGEAPRRRGN